MTSIIKLTDDCKLHRYNDGKFFLFKRSWFNNYILCINIPNEHETWVPVGMTSAEAAYTYYKDGYIKFLSNEFKRLKLDKKYIEKEMKLDNFEIDYPQYLI